MESDSTKDERTWAAGLHLSQLVNMIIPLGGFVVAIVIWQAKKEEFPALDAHGKMVVNWLISSLIYFVVCLVLSFVLIGIPMMVVLGLLSIGFAIFGAIKAYEGVLWSYPLTMRFLT